MSIPVVGSAGRSNMFVDHRHEAFCFPIGFKQGRSDSPVTITLLIDKVFELLSLERWAVVCLDHFWDALMCEDGIDSRQDDSCRG